MEQHLQAIVTVLSLVNPLICGVMFAQTRPVLEPVDGPQLGRRACCTCLESRDVEHVRDKAIQSSYLETDRRVELFPSGSTASLELSSTSLAVMIAVIGERRS